MKPGGRKINNSTQDVKSDWLSLLDVVKRDIVSGEQNAPDIYVSQTPFGKLTPREREVLYLVARGMNNPEIGQRLYISLNTVARHMTNIFSKTGTANRVEAALYAERNGIS